MLSIFINILLAFNIIVCLLLILLTLMQRPKNEGLGAAFGGGMTDNLFGAQTSNVLAQATRVLGTAFFVITLLLSVLYTRLATSPSNVQAQLASKPIPAAPAAKPGEGQPATVDTDVKAAIEAKLKEAAAKATPSASATPEASATPAPSAPVATPAPAK